MRKTSLSHVFSSEQSLSSLKCKCDIVFSVFLSLDQNLMKPEKDTCNTCNNKFVILKFVDGFSKNSLFLFFYRIFFSTIIETLFSS